MNRLKHLATATIFAALACTGLHAQSFDMRATIPFDFHAGDKTLPAGEYLIHEEGPLVWLRGEAGGTPSPIMLTFGVSGREPHQARLDFNCYGSDYFLTKVWDPYSRDGRQLLQTSREKEIAKRGNVPARAVVNIASSK
jgi:hypothetical protein